jgi:hypothetical protein
MGPGPVLIQTKIAFGWLEDGSEARVGSADSSRSFDMDGKRLINRIGSAVYVEPPLLSSDFRRKRELSEQFLR